ncbi:MAG: ABC transporter substrate-binding protein [Euryarchaeota archaeon]|nr:ABC transporter substrate-binding protein [Euryarchaeota archaeon]
MGMDEKKVINMKINILAGIIMMLLLVSSAAASDYTLGVFGNANEDDTINMQDVTYTELIILEYRDQTELSDAKHDGKINMQDVTQIELVILGKEKELTFLDIFGEAETVNKPIRRLANVGYYGIEVTRVLGARDILLPIVGYDRSIQPIFYPEISKWPAVGTDPTTCDLEYILSLKPDAVMTNLEARWAVSEAGLEKKRMFKEKLPGIPIICLNMREIDILSKNVRTYGYLLDREDEAEEFIDWYEGYMDSFEARTGGLSKDERPRVYFEMGSGHGGAYKTKSSSDRYAQAFILAGGYNIVDEIPNAPVSLTVDPEWVVEQNPEVILTQSVPWVYTASYETDDPSNMVAARQELMSRPELAKVDAVTNKHVYVVGGNILEGAGRNVIGVAYMGKLLQPDLFKDIDPQAIHQDYIDRFWRIDFDVYEHGVFMYPPLEES